MKNKFEERGNMETGIYTMPFEEYLALDRISNSYLKHLSATPANVKQKYVTTPAMTFGTACHTYVLEPDKFNNQIAVSPKIDRRTKVGKKLYAEFVAESEGKAVISADEMEVVQSMGMAIQSHPMASKLLSDGVAEQSIIFTDNRTELPCKARADWITEDGIMVDLKTTKAASQYGFLQEVVRYSYHMQASFYLTGMEKVSDKSYDRFIFIAVEKISPYRVECYELSDAFIEAGYYKYQELLDLELKCREEEFYPHYQNGNVVTLEKPAYL